MGNIYHRTLNKNIFTIKGRYEHYNNKTAVKKILSSIKIGEIVNETK